MTRKLFAGLALIFLAQPAYAQMGNGTRNGAVLGGVGGAVVGGIIGHQNHETPEGALIGGAVGAVAGGLIGNARDKQIQRDRYYQQQLYQQQQCNHHHYNNYNTYRSVPARSVPTRPVAQIGVTTTDVLAMTRSGVGESVIVNHVYATGVQRRLDTNEIIMLTQQGVGENVINAMQQAPVRTGAYATSTTVVAPQGGTVIVQEPTYVAPDYNQPPYTQPTYARPTYYNGPVRRGF
ncbi:MAG: glycine zipper domain-containing protein [Aureliella sp.]